MDLIDEMALAYAKARGFGGYTDAERRAMAEAVKRVVKWLRDNATSEQLVQRVKRVYPDEGPMGGALLMVADELEVMMRGSLEGGRRKK